MGECLGPDKRSTLNGGRGNPQNRAAVPSSGNEGREAYSTVVMTHAVIQNCHRTRGTVHLLCPGTSALSRQLRVTKCKLWMPIALVFCRVMALLGTATYTRRCVPHLFRK